MIRQADDQYNTHDHDDHFFSVDEFSAKGVAEESKRQLTNNVTDIGSRVDGAAKEERVGWSFDGWFA